METVFVVELEGAFEEFDIGDIFPKELDAAEGQAELKEKKQERGQRKQHPD